MKSDLSKKQSNIRQKCLKQNLEFKRLDKKKDYYGFHHSHYDWWAFPIDQKSNSYGDDYKLSESDIAVFSKDEEFLKALEQNAILVCNAWGFNLVSGQEIKQTKQHQSWMGWPIRLYKMTRSLQIFKRDALFKNAIFYGRSLIKKGNKFVYGKKDMVPYFMKERQIKIQELHSKQLKQVQ